jgi:hypothetical protein
MTLAAMVAASFPGSAGATVLYSNLANPGSGFSAVSSTAWAANAFSTDNNTYKLSDVILALEGVSTTGTLTVSLYSSSGGPAQPTTNLATLGTIADSALSTSMFTQQTVNVSNVTLAPNTQYFIVLSGSSSSGADADWEKEQGTTGIGVAGGEWGTSANSGSTWSMHGVSVDFAPYVMQVDASTPEPGSIFSALGGLAVVALARFRRRT